MTEPKEFLTQERLYEKYLHPFESIIADISKNGSYFEKQLLIWAVINYIPLTQFKEAEILITFYEDWLSSPEEELKRVYEYLGICHSSIDDISNHTKFKTPSITSDQKKFSNTSWKNNLSKNELASGKEILKIFGFDNLYDENSIPNHELIKQMLSKSK